jgi:hypothetical protein
MKHAYKVLVGNQRRRQRHRRKNNIQKNLK